MPAQAGIQKTKEIPNTFAEWSNPIFPSPRCGHWYLHNGFLLQDGAALPTSLPQHIVGPKRCVDTNAPRERVRGGEINSPLSPLRERVARH
ncbi:MAG: hypothetical protein RMI90_13500 [Thermoguttaceae bacterium]|nr:hypothetical protein [Thermoguttaceae bacterium]